MARSNLAKILKADLPAAAELLRKKGRRGDTILAHITPREAAKLKAEGGSGTTNPDTGLPEFYDGFDFGGMDFNLPADIAGPVEAGTQAAGEGYFTPSTYGNLQPVTGATMSQDVARMPGADILDLQQGVQRYAELQPEYYGIPSNVIAFQDQTGTPPIPVSAASLRAQAGGAPDVEQIAKDVAAQYGVDQEGKPIIDLTTAEKPGFLARAGQQITSDPLRALIAGLGVGGTGLSYLMSQAQTKKAQQALQNAYAQAAAQQRELAQPYMTQGAQQLGQALTGALSPVQQQQLQAEQARAAQQVAATGGVGAAQATRSLEDYRQRLLSQQQQLALSLLGAGTPLINSAIQSQLQGTVAGQQLGLNLSQQAGQAANNMLSALAALYGRGGVSTPTKA